jgi:hypothetical protein
VALSVPIDETDVDGFANSIESHLSANS